MDGKTVIGFTFIPEKNVYIGLIIGSRSTKPGMWSGDTKNILSSNENLNIAF